MAKHLETSPLPFVIEGFGWGYVHRPIWQLGEFRGREPLISDPFAFRAGMDGGLGWMIADPHLVLKILGTTRG